MPVELLIAPPASGKTQTCIQRIQQVQSANPLAKVWVVVPDRLQAAAFRRRLANAGGSLGTYIGTFRDLYQVILEDSGIYTPVASSPLMHQLVQETVDRAIEGGEMVHYTPLQHMPGFILALRESFSELMMSLVYPEDFLEFSKSRTPAEQDLACLYSRYIARLQEIQWADPAGIGWLAVEALERQKSMGSPIQLLVLDGFDSFSATHLRILKLFAQQVGELLITFPGKIASQRSAHRRTRQSIDRLIQELSPEVISTDHSPYLPANLLHIERHLFEAGADSAQIAGETILLEASSPADEAREALRWIKSLVVRQDVPLANCMIFTPNPATYHPVLRSYADEYGIPIRFTQDEPLSKSPAITALMSLLSLPAGNFNSRQLINIFRSPYFELDISHETVDQFEMISRVAQIVEGRDQWQETWERLVPSHSELETDIDEERTLPGLSRGAQAAELRNVLDDFFNTINPPNTPSTQADWIHWLEDLLEQLQFYENASNDRDQAACEVFRDTLRALVLSEEIAGSHPVDFLQFLKDLQGTLEGVSLREPPIIGQPALLVGRMTEARGVRFQAVALLGFSEGSFPVIERSDPFLSEDLRAALGLEPRLQREQAGLFYEAVTRSDQYLLITRPYLSDDGEKREKSTFWMAVEQLFDKSALKTIRPDDPQPLVEAASTQEILFLAVQRRGLPRKYDFLEDRWSGLRHAHEVIQARRSKTPSGPHEGYAPTILSVINQRYAPSHSWSASRLEAYGNCPFRFFIGAALKLEPRELPTIGLDASQMGSMVHKILEEAYKSAADAHNLQAVLAALETAAEGVFSTAPRVYGFRPSALWEYEKAHLLTKLKETIVALAEDSDWSPIAYEAKFGLEGTPPLLIDLNDEIVRIHGVIDRVDENSSGQLRVIDYKTGSMHQSQNDLIDGYRLQLPIYALAARDALDLGEPVDGFYWQVLNAQASSLKLAKVSTETLKGVEAAVELVYGHLIRILQGIRSAEFSPRPPRGGCPSYCPAASWCWRYEPGR